LQKRSIRILIYRRVVSHFDGGEEQLPSLGRRSIDIRRALGDPSISSALVPDRAGSGLKRLTTKYASSAPYRHTRRTKMREVIALLGMTEATESP
jgi:hypothetical protein